MYNFLAVKTYRASLLRISHLLFNLVRADYNFFFVFEAESFRKQTATLVHIHALNEFNTLDYFPRTISYRGTRNGNNNETDCRPDTVNNNNSSFRVEIEDKTGTLSYKFSRMRVLCVCMNAINNKAAIRIITKIRTL